MKYLIAFALLATTAQAQEWNTNTVAWDAPTTCRGGEPISTCPTTGYRVERSATGSGTYTAIGTTQTTTYTHTGAVAGTNCYRVVTLSGARESLPSQPACKTNTAPQPDPNPPTNLRFVTQVVNGMDHSPVYRLTSTGKKDARYSDACGYIPVGSQCKGNVAFSFRDKSFRAVNITDVKQWADCGTAVAAPCSGG